MNENNNKILDSFIEIRNRVVLNSSDSSYIYGHIESLNLKDIDNISILTRENITEVSDPTNNANISVESISNYIDKKIIIELKFGDINDYYENINSFINANKLKCSSSDYYIFEIQYREKDGLKNDFIEKYKTNLELIRFLKSLADRDIPLGNNLELFFYKLNNGFDIKIEYTKEQIEKINFKISTTLIESIQEPINGSDRKQLFINELTNFLEKSGCNYCNLLEGWGNLVSNYEKSYSLFLAGFSFDKIKNSSTEYFQNIVDRIYDSVSKVSNYIFGIPIGFILLLNNYDYSGESLLKNCSIVFLGVIFFTLNWSIFFKNIEDSIIAIEKDLSKFMNKIENISELKAIHDELSEFQNYDIILQKRKLRLVRMLTILIFVLFVFIFLYIFIDKSIFFI